MCGIAGALRQAPADHRSASGQELHGFVEKMTQAVRHRGPDGSGMWVSNDRRVVLGHRRLAILDLTEAGAQPMVDPDSGCAITYNGEIYNFPDLRRELIGLGEAFRSGSDTEVILKAYKRWGLDAVGRFRGIFALALWDPRTRVVHLVRDQMGIKPLYWTTLRDGDGGGAVVLFASEVRAVLASGAIPRRLDPAAVASFLWHGFVVGPHTMVEGVQLLPAATILTLDLDRAHPQPAPRRYWHLPSSSRGTIAPDELREELTRTVGMQLVSDVPLGVFLSGGIDSSSVAALASAVAPGGVHTFTIGFELPAYDEAVFARRVAGAIRSRHTTVVLTERDFEEQLEAAFAAVDQPTFDGLNTYFVSRAARNAGMTVALAGTGGDELFGGYPSSVDIPKLLRAGAWFPWGRPNVPGKAVFDSAVGLGAAVAGKLFWKVLRTSPPQTRWGKLADVARVAGDLLGLYQAFYALFTRETQEVLAGERVREVQRGQPCGLPPEVAQEWRQRLQGCELLHAISLLELGSFLGERLLRDTDAASMAVALEVRVPLLDPILAEAVAGVESERRFRPLGRKQLLRDLALDRLDPALFDRPKSGFVLPIASWARQRLQPKMADVFGDPELVRRAGLRGQPVQTLWRSFAAGRPGLYWTRVWALYVLLTWCRTHDLKLG